MQILHSFPKVVNRNFRRMMAFSGAMTKLILNVGVGKYRLSMVDAGMRQLNETTCTIEFVWWLLVLCKHLLIEWQWGGAFC
jgi:hypothetical protein